MSPSLPVVHLARHGETAWSLSGQHTGATDLPLTERGERDARALGLRLRGHRVRAGATRVRCSARAATCALAGFGGVAVADADLVEWNYGEYEGLRTAEILAQRPGWDLFRDGCPGGETRGRRRRARGPRGRADSGVAGNVLVFSSAHVLRVLAARWLGLPPQEARCFVLGTASLSALGYEHTANEPVIRLWNEPRRPCRRAR